MDAVKYLKERYRMCSKEDICVNCPMRVLTIKYNLSCDSAQSQHPEEAVEIVEKWSKEHPQKTMLNDLIEKHPKMSMDIEGVPRNICPHDLAYCKEMYCRYNTKNCKTCWNRPLEG